MWAFSLVLLALVSGFLAGHGFEVPIDLLPLVVAIVMGFLAMKATDVLLEDR